MESYTCLCLKLQVHLKYKKKLMLKSEGEQHESFKRRVIRQS